MPGGAATLGLAIASLLAAFVTALMEELLFLFRLSRFWHVLAGSALYAAVVWMWTIVAVLAYGNLASNPARPRTLRRVLSVSFNGLRFFPLIVLFAVGLPFFYAAALALLVNITDVLVSFSARDARWMPTRDLILSMAIALALQTAFVLHFMDDPFGAGLAMAAGSAAMLSLLLLVGLASADPGTNYRKCVASAAVAVALTAYFTLAGRSYLAHGFPSVPDARPAPAGNQPPPGDNGDSAESVPTSIGDGAFTGVILWPEIEKQTKIVAPLPVWHGMSQGVMAQPTTIPFSGEYWLYRLPYKQPPRGSYKRRGSPAKLFFHTTQGDPLSMEAKQKLDLPVALSCCARIRLAIHDADPHPASVLLELILIDSLNGPRRELSLGSNMIGVSTAEEIDFIVPASAAIRQFNEIQVVFHRDRMNQSRSARVAIDRFVLLPRGV